MATNTLSVIFTPTDTVDYSLVTNTVSLLVFPPAGIGLILGAEAAGNVISEYSVNGKTAIASLVSNLSEPLGLSVANSDIFVANYSANTIGQYSISGATINASLISVPGPIGIAVSGTNLYVVSNPGGGGASILHYTTSGLSLASIATGLPDPYALALSGAELFVADPYRGSVLEFGTDGSGGSPIFGGGLFSYGLAVDGTNIYVADNASGTIGQYTTSGVALNPSLITNLTNVGGLAVDGNGHLFIAANGTISEFTTLGEIINSSILPTTNGPVSFNSLVFVPILPPTILNAQLTGNTISFSWNAILQQTYQIQSTSNLLQSNWNNVGESLTASNAIMTVFESIGTNSQQFYRVVLAP